jgi:hypothetical protein
MWKIVRVRGGQHRPDSTWIPHADEWQMNSGKKELTPEEVGGGWVKHTQAWIDLWVEGY